MPLIEPARELLALVSAPVDAEQARRTAVLTRELNKLSMAFEGTSPAELGEGDDAIPRSDQELVRQGILRALPNLGYYSSILPSMRAVPTVGDAVDDLVEIATELIQIEWRWRNTGPADATAHFNFGYRTHWGRHLMNLRSYLHSQRFET